MGKLEISIAGKNAQKFPKKSLKKTLKIEIYLVKTHLFSRNAPWPKSAKKHLSVFPAITLGGTERFFSVFVCKKTILFSVFLSDHFRRDWAFFRAFKSLKKTLKSSLKNRWKKRSNVCFRWGKWKFQSLEKTLKSSPKNRSKKRSNDPTLTNNENED